MWTGNAFWNHCLQNNKAVNNDSLSSYNKGIFLRVPFKRDQSQFWQQKFNHCQQTVIILVGTWPIAQPQHAVSTDNTTQTLKEQTAWQRVMFPGVSTLIEIR